MDTKTTFALGALGGLCAGMMLAAPARQWLASGRSSSSSSGHEEEPKKIEIEAQNKITEFDTGSEDKKEGPRRLRKAERVLAGRTSRLILVIERSYDEINQVAILRTAEAMGVQHVWIVLPAIKKPEHRNEKIAKERKERGYNAKVSRTAMQWMTMRTFNTPRECIAALREDGREIWTTELSQEAHCLDHPGSVAPFPERVALVVGRETDGVSKEMQEAADKRFYLPIRGWADSYNLGIATALILQKMFDYYPGLVGAMGEEERSALRENWYEQLGKTATQKKEYAGWAQHPPSPFGDLRRPDVHRDQSWVLPKIKKRQTAAEQMLDAQAQAKGAEEAR